MHCPGLQFRLIPKLIRGLTSKPKFKYWLKMKSNLGNDSTMLTSPQKTALSKKTNWTTDPG